MDQTGVGHGLNHHETTDEWIAMIYPCFNGFNNTTEGVSRDDIMKVIGQTAL